MKARDLGFSLIEILVVMGLMGLISLFVMSLTKIGLSGQRSVVAMDDARNLTSDMATLLMNPTACLNTFGGLNPTAAGGASVSQLKNAAGTASYKTNTIYGNRTLKLTSVVLGGVGI